MEGDRGGATGPWTAVVERAATLTDDDRLALADARRAVDETFHVGAWRAAVEVAGERASDYLAARLAVGTAFLPVRLEELVELGNGADPAELARWQEVARLCRTAIDDAILARIGADRLRPPDLRQLTAAWRAMLEAAHERSA